mgnify:CR=1 FL=1
MWTLYYTRQAQKDARKLASSGLKTKAQQLLAILQSDPWQTPPPFEKLVGDLTGAYSRRLNIQHRLVYQVLEAEKAVKVLRLWTHYEQSLLCVARIIGCLGTDKRFYRQLGRGRSRMHDKIYI